MRFAVGLPGSDYNADHISSSQHTDILMNVDTWTPSTFSSFLLFPVTLCTQCRYSASIANLDELRFQVRRVRDVSRVLSHSRLLVRAHHGRAPSPSCPTVFDVGQNHGLLWVFFSLLPHPGQAGTPITVTLVRQTCTQSSLQLLSIHTFRT